MFRSPVNSVKDEAIFRRTASHTKAVNLGMKVYRGGFRF